MAEAAYRQYFYEQEHLNYYTEEPDIGPCLLSIKNEGQDKYRQAHYNDPSTANWLHLWGFPLVTSAGAFGC